MRSACLIVNPSARVVARGVESSVEKTLGGAFSVEVVETEAPLAATKIARRAAEDGVDVVVAFGGDGLVNEVVNGVVGTDASLGVIPGGTMNVFARSLGLPRHPETAAARLAAVADGPGRVIDLGRANGRYFTFACGCGFDAETATRVDAHRRKKHRLGEPYFYAAAVTTLAGSYAARAPFLRCEGDFRPRPAVMAIALVGRPYAYLAGRALHLGMPRAPQGGLSLFVLRDLRLWRLPEYAAGALFTGRFGRGAELIEGLPWVRVSAEGAVPAHVDGERLPSANEVVVEAAEAALHVLV